MRIKIAYDQLSRQLVCYVFEEKNGEEELVDVIPLGDEESEDDENVTH